MATPDITAGEIMNLAASLLNDTAKQVYPYTVQIPYLTMALQDLRKLLELNNSPVTDTDSAVIELSASDTSVGFGTVDPKLPDDLIEIQELWERPRGIDPFIQMTRRNFIPLYLSGVPTSQYIIWSWQSNTIKLPQVNQANDLKINYIKNLFGMFEDENSIIGVINSDSYLQYRTAALCAEFVGENPGRATSLNLQAKEAFDTLIGIDNKGRQAISTRRRPFRASWKNRGIW